MHVKILKKSLQIIVYTRSRSSRLQTYVVAKSRRLKFIENFKACKRKHF